jgi:hypothetical protein
MRRSLLALALFTLVACDNSPDSTAPGPNLNGTYTLSKVDNKDLPVAFADSSLLSGQLVMTDSGWTQVSVVQYVAGGSAGGDSLKLAGFWAASGNNLTFWDLGINTQYTGTFSSAGITLTTKTATVLSYSR